MNCCEIWWKYCSVYLRNTSDIIDGQVYFLASEAQKHPYRDGTAELASLTLQREDFFFIIAPQKK